MWNFSVVMSQIPWLIPFWNGKSKTNNCSVLVLWKIQQKIRLKSKTTHLWQLSPRGLYTIPQTAINPDNPDKAYISPCQFWLSSSLKTPNGMNKTPTPEMIFCKTWGYTSKWMDSVHLTTSVVDVEISSDMRFPWFVWAHGPIRFWKSIYFAKILTIHFLWIVFLCPCYRFSHLCFPFNNNTWGYLVLCCLHMYTCMYCSAAWDVLHLITYPVDPVQISQQKMLRHKTCKNAFTHHGMINSIFMFSKDHDPDCLQQHLSYGLSLWWKNYFYLIMIN